jgi:hypothetical protein
MVCHTERRSGRQRPRNTAAFADGRRPTTLKDSTMRVHHHRLWDGPRMLAVGSLLLMAGVGLKVSGDPQWGGALAGGGAFAMLWACGRRPADRSGQ